MLSNRERTVVFVAGSIFIILTTFTSVSVTMIHREINGLQDVLSTKQELANLATHIGPSDPALAGLSGTCTSCHTSETFAQSHGTNIDVRELVARMNDLSGANIPQEEIPRVEAALTFMKCAHCHTIDKLKELAILSPEERWSVIVKMMKSEGSEITPDDAQRIRNFYGDFWGWHTR